MKCPSCQNEMSIDPADPSKVVCYTCRKRYPANKVEQHTRQRESSTPHSRINRHQPHLNLRQMPLATAPHTFLKRFKIPRVCRLQVLSTSRLTSRTRRPSKLKLSLKQFIRRPTSNLFHISSPPRTNSRSIPKLNPTSSLSIRKDNHIRRHTPKHTFRRLTHIKTIPSPRRREGLASLLSAAGSRDSSSCHYSLEALGWYSALEALPYPRKTPVPRAAWR